MNSLRAVASFFCLSFFLFSFTEQKMEKDVVSQESHLKEEISKIVADLDPGIKVGITVLSLKDGRILYEKNQNDLFIPGSSIKIFTAYNALGILGHGFTFETKFLSNAKPGKVLESNLYVRGSGDPTFSEKDLEKMVIHLKTVGIQTISGNIVLDATAFDNIYGAPGIIRFDDDYEGLWDAKVSALSINQNCLDVLVTPTKPSQPPLVRLVPDFPLAKLTNQATTVETGKDLKILKKAAYELTGQIGIDQGEKKYYLPVDEPPEFFAKVLLALLEKHDIKVEGRVVFGPSEGASELLAVHFSEPLSHLLVKMMKTSHNLYGDAFFKAIGYKEEMMGSWQSGKRAGRDHIRKNIASNVEDLCLFDGSGLSHASRITPRQTAEFLQQVYYDLRVFPEFVASLPIGGQDGSLASRLKDKNPKAQIRAKTGTLTGVSALVGYLTTSSGESLAFVIIGNGIEGSVKNFRANVEDKIAVLLTNLEKEGEQFLSLQEREEEN